MNNKTYVSRKDDNCSLNKALANANRQEEVHNGVRPHEHTIEAFCRIYVEECKAEGVRAEVAFCQAMKETGYLRYGGNVKIEQFNFAGIGSTGAGVAGTSYLDVRTGIRAQIQHLKAYASTESLKNACVDDRFSYVTRGSAPYVEWLGQKENPYGKGWATATNYGYDERIKNILKNSGSEYKAFHMKGLILKINKLQTKYRYYSINGKDCIL